MAILREQGVNGHVEMAAAFDRAGFECVDVHMSDVIAGGAIAGGQGLSAFRGLVACGGFSFGDVLGAGEGWAKSILFNPRARDAFQAFFARGDTFSLGICNGCQMLSNLGELIDGSEGWPRFVQNRSGRFEARLVTVEIARSPSVLLAGMEGSRLPVPVAHGEGRAELPTDPAGQPLVVARYVDGHGAPTQRYPLNPNGSPSAIAGVTSRDGRVTLMMPHPERVFRAVQHSYLPPRRSLGPSAAWTARPWTEDGPWMRLFRNARAWVG